MVGETPCSGTVDRKKGRKEDDGQEERSAWFDAAEDSIRFLREDAEEMWRPGRYLEALKDIENLVSKARFMVEEMDDEEVSR